jgi:dual specificity phosphatase 12
MLYRDQKSRPQQPQTDGLAVSAVLGILRARRPVCDPNPGFLQQLEVYRTMGCPIDEQKMDVDPLYQEWVAATFS